jgi:hypothetical protein
MGSISDFGFIGEIGLEKCLRIVDEGGLMPPTLWRNGVPPCPTLDNDSEAVTRIVEIEQRLQECLRFEPEYVEWLIFSRVCSLDGQSPDWSQVLFDKQVVVVEVLETRINSLAWGFCQQSIQAMNQLPGK